MAKFLIYCDTGFAGAKHEDEYEIDDENLVHMTLEEIEAELEEAAQDLKNNNVDTGYRVFESGDNWGNERRVEDEQVDNLKKIMKAKGALWV